MGLLLLLGAHLVAGAPCALIGIMMDESGSMGGEQAWIVPTLTSIYQGIEEAGFDSMNMLCVTGYGSFAPAPRALGPGCSMFSSTSSFSSIFGSFRTSGAQEDGYWATQFMIDLADDYVNDNAGAIGMSCDSIVRQGILITDEDRDVLTADTRDSINASLNAQDWLYNAVVNIASTSFQGDAVIGVGGDGTAYLFDGTSDYTSTTPGAIDVTTLNGAISTEIDYFPLAWDNGGVSWDLNRLRAGGNLGAAFSQAFVDVKVEEVVEMVPDPPTSAPTFGTPMPTGLPVA